MSTKARPTPPQRRPLESLRPGQAFRYRDRKGKLVRITPGSAVVDLVIPSPRQFITRDGRAVRILRSRERTAWSRATIVEVRS